MRPSALIASTSLLLLRKLGADEVLLAAVEGGLDVRTRQQGQVMLHSVLQIDGDIITYVSSGLPEESKLAEIHFQRVEAKAKALIASINKLLAVLVALPTGLLMALTLGDALDGNGMAWFALLAEFLAATSGLALPGPRKLISRVALGPAIKWIVRKRGPSLLGMALR